MDEAHFRPPLPLQTARILLLLAGVAIVGGAIGWSVVGWVAVLGAVVVAGVLTVFAVLLRRVELIVNASGVEVVDITGRRRQAWVGTERLTIDFARSRPMLEIDAPGPGRAYRSTLVLAGLEGDEHVGTRARLEDLVHRWAGKNVVIEIRQPDRDRGAG